MNINFLSKLENELVSIERQIHELEIRRKAICDMRDLYQKNEIQSMVKSEDVEISEDAEKSFKVFDDDHGFDIISKRMKEKRDMLYESNNPSQNESSVKVSHDNVESNPLSDLEKKLNDDYLDQMKLIDHINARRRNLTQL